MSTPANHMLRSAAETVALLAPLAALLTCAYLQIEQSGLLTLLVGCAALAVFFCGFEAGKPALRQIMPTATLGALAAAGRILFAPIPDFKPVSAICIIAGAVFGKHSGFMVGALAALCSNFFFGQGPWTPWQMYAWGLVGYVAGVLANNSVFALSERLGAHGPSALLWLSVRIGLRLHPEQLVYRGIPGTGNVARGAGSLPGRPAARLGP